MKVLFLSSGNKKTGISSIVKSQGESLVNLGIEIKYCTIKGKGIVGYLRNIPAIKQAINNFNPDIVHAHYLFSGIMAALSGARPMVVSLMGTDARRGPLFKVLTHFFNKKFWHACIVKSLDMKLSLGLKKVHVIPNGVDINHFNPRDKNNSKKKIGWDMSKQHILFAADPQRKEKNYSLAKEAVELLNQEVMEFHYLENVAHNDMPLFFNAADVMIMTSLWEGSPNVVKEAMACNLPVVSTDVGDVAYLIKDVRGNYISSPEKDDVAKNLNKALAFSKKGHPVNSRERLIKLGLDSDQIAKKIIEIYRTTIENCN